MGILVTLVLAIAVLAVASQALWPRRTRPPLPLYAGTIMLAFFAGMFLGQLADGKDAGKAVASAAIVSPLILIVALVSWFKISPAPPRNAGAPPLPPPAPEPPE